MNEKIFRKKSIDKVRSPESLNDYIRVSNPSVSLLMISIIVLLAGACVWGLFGRIESTVNTNIRIENGKSVCYVSEVDIVKVAEGMEVKADDFNAVISVVGEKEGSSYICEIETEEYVIDGIYDGKIITNSIRPLSFVLN